MGGGGVRGVEVGTGVGVGKVTITIDTVEVVATLTSTGNPDDPNEVEFSEVVHLTHRGASSIVTTATDETGKANQDTRPVYWDLGPPELSFTPADGASASPVEVPTEGTATGSKPEGSKKKDGSKASGTGSDPAKTREKALTQTLAAWLNFAKGAVDLDELIDTDKDGIADTAFSDLIAEVEGILLNQDATKDDLNRAKKLAETANKHDKDNPECDTGTGSKSGTKSKTGTKSGTGSKSGTGKKGKK